MGSGPEYKVYSPPPPPEMTEEGRRKAEQAAQMETQRKRGKSAQLIFGGNRVGAGSTGLSSGMNSGGSLLAPPQLSGF